MGQSVSERAAAPGPTATGSDTVTSAGSATRGDRVRHTVAVAWRRTTRSLRLGGQRTARWTIHRWLASLQLRVVTTTMLLGVVVVLLLGSSLYQSIANGLVADRVNSAKSEADAAARSAQANFDATNRSDADGLSILAGDVVRALAVPGAGQARSVVLTRTLSNKHPTVVPTVLAGPVTLATIPNDLRRAVSGDSSRQQVQMTSVTDPDTGASVPAVVVGSQVILSVAGPYDLYFVFAMQREQATLAVVARTFSLGGLALVLLLGAVAWVVTRLVVSPVRQAAEVAERLSSGRLTERMRVRGQDDLARLATSFNAMAESLQQQIRQLEELSTVQQRFVSDVSHELRTPLTTIRMAGELLHDSRHTFEPAASRSAELLRGELDRFEELLADLLEISRFDAGATVLDAEATDLRNTIARVVASTATLAERKGSVVTVVAPATPCVAEIDPRRVERILRNLVVNAIEHGEGGPIEVAVAVTSKAAAVSVRDHGVGLRPGEAALVFDRFWRADPARARTTGGTGLGLAIALEDALLHHGWLQAWGAPGEGSCFRLTIPRRAGVRLARSPLPLAPDDRPSGAPTSRSSSGRRLPGPSGPSGLRGYAAHSLPTVPTQPTGPTALPRRSP